MSYRLSLLDKSPIAPGTTSAEAVAATLALARRADQLGYHRFWLAEHHGLPVLASAAPEVLVAHLLAQTRRIRIGSGGVLLQHYAPYKVAEVFSVLATLAPGRVDLGIGKSPGGLPQSTRALQSDLRPGAAAEIDRKLDELETALNGPLHGAEISPRAVLLPERFLLGASPASARRAAELGWNFVHAGHQDGDAATTRTTIEAFRAISGKPPVLALVALAAPSRAEAEDRVAGLQIVRPIFADGHAVNLTTEAAAHAYAEAYGSSDYRIEIRKPTVLAGTADDIHDTLGTLAREHGLEEFILDIPVPEAAARQTSIDLIATRTRQAAA